MTLSARFRSGRFVRRVTLQTGIAFSAVMLLIMTTATTELSVGFFASWYSMIASILLFMFLTVFLRCHFGHPEQLQVAVFGLPKSGKTVFLDTLMSKTKKYQVPGVRVHHRNDRACKAYDSLTKQHWPGRTIASRDEFPVEVSLGPQILPARWNVKLTDYTLIPPNSGEELSIETVTNAGGYELVKTSDAVLLFIDAVTVVDQHQNGKHDACDIYTKAVEEIIAAHPGQFPVEVPLAVLFTKVDCTQTVVENSELAAMLRDFITLCRRRFKEFRMFYVTSVGHVTEDGMPALPIESKNVIEPFLWTIRKFE